MVNNLHTTKKIEIITKKKYLKRLKSKKSNFYDVYNLFFFQHLSFLRNFHCFYRDEKSNYFYKIFKLH